MVRLSEPRYDFIYHILRRIVLCEGGSVETITTEKGNVIIQITPDIPPQFWCDECKKRAICKVKIMARWARI